MTNSRLLNPQLSYLLLTIFLFTIHRSSFIGSTWDKDINKREMKTCAILSINFQNLQIIFAFVTDTNLHKPLILAPNMYALKIDKTILKSL